MILYTLVVEVIGTGKQVRWHHSTSSTLRMLALSLPFFSSLSLFQLLRQPLMFLPRALSATSDARGALLRLTKIFTAETKDPRDAITVDPDQELALDVKGATFEWEESNAADDSLGDLRKGKGYGSNAGHPGKKGPGATMAVGAEQKNAGPPFQVKDVTMAVPRGSLVAIVGSVGRYVRYSFTSVHMLIRACQWQGIAQCIIETS